MLAIYENQYSCLSIGARERQAKENERWKEDNSIELCKICAYYLYKKYIKIGSELQINISGRLRVYFKLLMDDKYLWLNDKNIVKLTDLLGIFDDCLDFMMTLLKGTSRRFLKREMHEYVHNVQVSLQME